MSSFFVAGIPQSQGSARAFVVGGKAVVTDNNPKNKSWREAVRSGYQEHCTTKMEGAVEIMLSFVMPRPQSHPKTKFIPHTKKPDVDKLIRSCMDAGKGVAWGDDSQVVKVTASKRYAKAEEQCGVWVRLVDEPQIESGLFT